MITINIEKAKEIKKEKIRIEREPILKTLDVEFYLALESGDLKKQQEIASKKQYLRDATKHSSIINAESIEDLKNISLEDLIL